MQSIDWAAYDLETPSGIKIEIKSSAYLQAWNDDHIYDIRFGIQPTKAWDAKAGYSEDMNLGFVINNILH